MTCPGVAGAAELRTFRLSRGRGDRISLGMIDWREIERLASRGNHPPPRQVRKTEAEWRTELTDDEFRVTREHGTERAFSSQMCSLFEPGRYACRCCGTLLFDASSKFESGTGWPSFSQPASPDVIAYVADRSYGMVRIETRCNVCEAHLGHVFPDGPPPSRLRYCMNAVALRKLPA